MRLMGSVTRILLGCCILLDFSFGCSKSKSTGTGPDASACPDDERMHFTPELTLANLCASNGHTIIVRFQTAQTVDQVLPLLQPVGGELACDDAAALQGQPGKTCYLVRLGSDQCCGDGMAYFESLTPPASTDMPDPATPCSCSTHWTSQ